MPRFIGIDLAWSEKHASGLAALDYNPETKVASLLELPQKSLVADHEIITFVKEMAGEDQTTIVAIDAPLAVCNEEGQRYAEASLNKAFHRFHAGAHPANRKRLGAYNDGKVRGEEITKKLGELGIYHHPKISPGQPTRQVFEVYPHPAMVVLFRLDKILKYKRRGDNRLGEFQKYQGHLRELQKAFPALILPDADNILSEERAKQRGAKLKNYEDQLDAIFCAYIGLYYWYWGEKRCHIFADPTHDYTTKGYIISPLDERIGISDA